MLLKRFCGLAALLLIIASAAPAKGATYSYLLTVARGTGGGVALFHHRPLPGFGGYQLTLYGFSPVEGGVWLASYWSRHEAGVARGPGDCFWVLANRGRGSEAVLVGAKCFRLGRKFAWHAALYHLGPPAIATASDGTVWLWLASKSWRRIQLRVFSPGLRRQLGVYALPRQKKMVIYWWALAGKQAVVFINTTGRPLAKTCDVLVINEGGRVRATDLTKRIGWHPFFLSSAGSFFSGLAPARPSLGPAAHGRVAFRKMVSFEVLPSGKLARVRTVRVASPQHRTFFVAAYALLDQHTALASLELRHGSGYSYELARISVASGKVERSVAIPYPAHKIIVSSGVVYLMSNGELIRAYTPSLRLLGRYQPINPVVAAAAVAPARGP